LRLSFGERNWRPGPRRSWFAARPKRLAQSPLAQSRLAPWRWARAPRGSPCPERSLLARGRRGNRRHGLGKNRKGRER